LNPASRAIVSISLGVKKLMKGRPVRSRTGHRPLDPGAQLRLRQLDRQHERHRERRARSERRNLTQRRHVRLRRHGVLKALAERDFINFPCSIRTTAMCNWYCRSAPATANAKP
jgi:hypothetical protein